MIIRKITGGLRKVCIDIIILYMHTAYIVYIVYTQITVYIYIHYIYIYTYTHTHFLQSWVKSGIFHSLPPLVPHLQSGYEVLGESLTDLLATWRVVAGRQQQGNHVKTTQTA